MSGMKFRPSHTPSRVTQSITAACSALVPDEEPVYVPREPYSEALINKCTFNVRQYLRNNPGRMVTGWDISVWDGVLLDAIGHAVVEHNGALVCISPSKYGDSRVLFLRDDRLSFDFDDSEARMPRKQIPISKSREVARLIELEATEVAIKSKYPVGSGQIIVGGQDAITLQQIARDKSQLMLRISLSHTDNASPCVCGSGRKFRKCCRSQMERMVRPMLRA
jgi:SEC-C motif